MKKYSVLWIAGGAIVVGAVAYGVYKYFKSTESVASNSQDASSANSFHAAEEVTTDSPVSTFAEAQQETVSAIKDRHVAAAQQMEKTLSDMATDCAEFEEKIEQANNDLDELLK